jgi:hypothetical protein
VSPGKRSIDLDQIKELHRLLLVSTYLPLPVAHHARRAPPNAYPEYLRGSKLIARRLQLMACFLDLPPELVSNVFDFVSAN